MVSLTSILEHNQRFVSEKKYEPYKTTKFPSKKLVIVTCMDTRLTELLPQAMGLKNGDAKIVKTRSHRFSPIWKRDAKHTGRDL